MIIHSEAEMMDFGKQFAQCLELPAVFELIGDVGVGKTTFTRGLAKGLKIKEPITSPSFTISKRYALDGNGELVHYDFYRLDNPGLMSEELAESISEPNKVIVIEWGGDVTELLPSTKYSLKITLQDDGSRQIDLNSAAQDCLAKGNSK